MRDNKKNSLSANYYNDKQIDSICTVLTDFYTEKKLDEGKLITQIDIEDFVVNILGCKIVYESINSYSSTESDKEEDCLGFCSDGIEPISVIRNGHAEDVVFPKDTIVIDRYLNEPNLSNRKRFTIAHEAGHVIKNRMTGVEQAEYNHVNGVVLTSVPAMRKRYSYHEIEANKFAASLLMPEGMVAMLMHKYHKGEPIVVYQGNIVSGKDLKIITFMAKILGVAYSTMYYILQTLGFLVDGVLENYVEDTVIGGNNND